MNACLPSRGFLRTSSRRLTRFPSRIPFLVRTILQGQVYCHRRTKTKRVFPSMYDMFIGGVSGSMEPALDTALRELGEELGLGPLGGCCRGGSEDTAAGEKVRKLFAVCVRAYGYTRAHADPRSRARSLISTALPSSGELDTSSLGTSDSGARRIPTLCCAPRFCLCVRTVRTGSVCRRARPRSSLS